MCCQAANHKLDAEPLTEVYLPNTAVLNHFVRCTLHQKCAIVDNVCTINNIQCFANIVISDQNANSMRFQMANKISEFLQVRLDRYQQVVHQAVGMWVGLHNARAISRRWRSPPERLTDGVLRKCVIPNSAIKSSSAASRSSS